MRVETKTPEPVFEEIHIVLENEEDAAKMYHLTNKAKGKSLVQYCQEHQLDINAFDAFTYTVFQDLEEAFFNMGIIVFLIRS